MLSNAYFLAKFRFDTAENEPAKNLQNFRKMHFSEMNFRKMHFRRMHFRKMHFRKMHCSLRRRARTAAGSERGRGALAAPGGRGADPTWTVHRSDCASMHFRKNAFSKNAFFENFANFWRARSRLYQNQILQANMRSTAFFKLYKICILLHLSLIHI